MTDAWPLQKAGETGSGPPFYHDAARGPGHGRTGARRSVRRESDLEAPTPFGLLDLVSEVGELAKDATESTEYGSRSDEVEVEVTEDELGNVLFSLLALADGLGVDAGEALDLALSKYERRLEETGGPASGE